MTFTGNNTYGGGTVINAGTLQVGNGGSSGSVGFGPVTDNTLLIFNRAGILNVGTVSGVGSVQQVGSGTVTLAGTNTYTGLTTVSNGVLIIGAGSTIGDVELEGGMIAPGGFGVGGVPGDPGAITVGNMGIAAGSSVVVSLNKGSVPSNSVVTLTGGVTNFGGASVCLRVFNFGPTNGANALAPGDKFTIFSQPVVNGNLMTILSPGMTLNNLLAVDGSITVASVAAGGSTLTVKLAGGGGGGGKTNIISWPDAYKGLHLQVQTNAVGTGLKSNWVTVPGSDVVTSYTNAMPSGGYCVFYRLIAP